MASHKSDLPAAALGFFGGAIVLALILFGVSRATTAKFADHHTPPAQTQ